MSLLCGAAAIILGGFMLLLSVGHKSPVSDLTIGTYGENIYSYTFNHEDGTFTLEGTAEARNASYAVTAKGTDGKEYIYAVSEVGGESGVYSFKKEGANPFKKEESIVQTAHKQQTGADPCFVLLYDGGKYMMTADYSGGSISVFPIEGGNANDAAGIGADDVAAGAVKDLCASLSFTGEGPDKARQESSHIHQLKELPSQSGRWILASDLGADVIRLVAVENNGIRTDLKHIKDIPCPTGSGPRHMEFNADYTVLYCITELSGEVLVYDIEHNNSEPTFTLIQQIQADEVNARGSADIHIHPSGKWLYTSHRLDNDGISVFSILPDGTLEKIGYTRTGRHPRNFMITDDGAYLLVACRDDKLIQVFSILPDGTLSLTESTLQFESDRPSSILQN